MLPLYAPLGFPSADLHLRTISRLGLGDGEAYYDTPGQAISIPFKARGRRQAGVLSGQQADRFEIEPEPPAILAGPETRRDGERGILGPEGPC